MENCTQILAGLERVLVGRGATRNNAKQQAAEILFWLMEAWCHGMFGLVADAVGLQVLDEVYREIRDKANDLSIEYIDLRIRLNHFQAFPESRVLELEERTRKKHFSNTLLHLAVWEHFFLYRENYKVKQRVCAKLGIGIKEVPALPGRRP